MLFSCFYCVLCEISTCIRKKYFFLFWQYKISNSIYLPYYKRHKELISAKNKEYYQKNKDRLSTQARERYCNLSEEKKKERLEYEKNRRQSMSEEDKIKRREYRRNCYFNLSEDV